MPFSISQHTSNLLKTQTPHKKIATWHIRNFQRKSQVADGAALPPFQIVCGFEKGNNLRKLWKSLPRCKEERARNGLKERDV
jgi:hypothetical protein